MDEEIIKNLDQKGEKKTDFVKKKIFRELKGLVTSDKMNKTIVVRVDIRKSHSIYKKKYTVSKKYKAHDELNQYKAGDFVLIRQCRPLSKDKRWKVIKKIK